MSVSSEITRIENNISLAYTELQSLGATIPLNKNSNNLASTIRTVPKFPPIYGVSGLTTSSQGLTRTDDAVNLDYSIDDQNGTIDSDFDDVFPWNEVEIINDAAGKFLKMPDMFFRIGVDGSQRLTDIAVSKCSRTTGKWYKVDSFLISCYKSSLNANDKLESVSGATIIDNKTISELRTYAENNGQDYFLYDLYHLTVMRFLWMIEFATKNSNNIMYGSRLVSLSGGTDNIATPSGFVTNSGQMRYHYIEDFIGNYCDYIDGIIVNNLTIGYDPITGDPIRRHGVTNKTEKYNFGSTDKNVFSALSYPLPSLSEGCVSALGWDNDNPFMCMPIEVVTNNNFDTHFCSCYYTDYYVSVYILVIGRGAGSSQDVGGYSIFSHYTTGELSENPGFSCRLLKKCS